MAVFSVGEVICLVTPFNDRDFGLLNHVKFDSHTCDNINYFFSDMPIDKYMTNTIAVYFLKRVIGIKQQLQLQFLFTRNYN